MTTTVGAPRWVLGVCPAEDGGCGGRRRMPEGWEVRAYCAAGAVRPGAGTGGPAGRPFAGTFLPGLRAARMAAGVSERVPGSRTGTARNTVYAYEAPKHRASWPRARAIARVLGVPVGELARA